MRRHEPRANALALAFLITMAGCAANTEAPPAAPAGSAVTATSSAPDAAGFRAWWIFTDGSARVVRARTLGEALTLAELAPERVGDVMSTTPKPPSSASRLGGSEEEGWTPAENSVIRIPISGGGR